ncbi:MAG: DnaJ domain-containing protein [Gammaproteobacteria bacterium]|nr:DnaJ domain-containing protein [Gammaproteobacteria bacterium]
MSDDRPNYYDVLHVSRSAPEEVIRSSYRAMMQQLKNHPDLGGDPATASLINEAYAVLTNASRRAEYDARLDLMDVFANGVGDRPGDVAETSESAAAAGEEEAPAQRIINPYKQCAFCEAAHGHGQVIEANALCESCGSPLAVAENRRMESSDQRAVARIDKQQNVRFFTHWPQREGFAGQTEDISLNGLRLVTGHDLVAGQCIKIISNVVEAVGNVTHCNWSRRRWKTKCVAGVSFVTLRFPQPVGGFVSQRV